MLTKENILSGGGLSNPTLKASYKIGQGLCQTKTGRLPHQVPGVPAIFTTLGTC